MGISVLYVLMRTDMASMNPGKGHAQSNHAGTKFMSDYYKSQKVDDWIEGWISSAGGFGTVLTLDVGNEDRLLNAVDVSKRMGFVAGVVYDPTYPLVDGKVVHYLPVNTCGYVFVPDKDDALAKAILGNFPLCP